MSAIPQSNDAATAGPSRSAPSPSAPAGRPQNGGWLGPAGLGLAAGMLGIVALVRVIVGIPKVTQSYYNSFYAMEDRSIVWLILGVLMIASILPIAVSVVLGHLGVGRAKAAGTSAVASGIALGIGYTLAVFWVVRLVNAITNAAQFNSGLRVFVEYVGVWA